MRCPYCKHNDTKVLETREAENNTRRRRECLKCTKRFTTYEQIEILNLTIIKKDGSKEQFDQHKLIKGMLRACEKRPVTQEQIAAIASDIETKLLNHKKTEVRSAHVGEMVMRRLKKVDAIAYLRFASVYRDFTGISSFEEELQQLLGEEKKKQNAVTQ